MVLSSAAFILTLASAVLAIGLAALVLRSNVRGSANRWLALGLLVISVHQVLLVASHLIVPELWRVALVRAAFGVLAAMPPIWLGFSLAFGGKNGGLRTSRWYPILPTAALVAFATTIPLALGRGLQLISIGTTGEELFALDGWGKVLFSVYLVGLVLVLTNIENLYRNATSPLRQTLTALTLGIFFALACQIVATSHTLLFALIHPSAPLVSAAGFIGGQTLIAYALARHRLLDSNVYVSRYVAYRSITLLLVGGYLLTLGISAELLPRLNISLDFLTGGLFIIAAGITLAFFLFSENIRWRFKLFVQAHFYRHKYDYREEWMEFTRHLSSATSAAEVAARTTERVLKVMWVRQAAVYEAAGQAGRFHLLHQIGYPEIPATLALSDSLMRSLTDGGARLPSAGRTEERSTGREGQARDLFPNLPVGHVAPLLALEKPVGLLVVGPEMSGKPFGVDDKDLLAAVGSQAGAMIASARLAQEAAEHRELQVLARFSAFIAHDLKNAVGMLSLLAENAPAHIQKPEFQADAIRTLTSVTGRMQRLLATLAGPNSRPSGQSVQASLVAQVERWLPEIKTNIPSRISLETTLEPTPEVILDPDHLRTVLANLVLNAVDAIPGDGRIVVETRAENGWAILSVADNGRGMPGDFVRDRLFRPFQTTKPRGLGIGLYQCKHIVQTLGGELTAESQEGVGTRMTVKLPTAGTLTLTAEDAKHAEKNGEAP